MPFLFLFFRGEWFLFLLVFAAIVILPIIIAGVVFFTLRKNKLSRAAWQKLANEIGFSMRNPKQMRMTGSYNGIATMLSVGTRRRSDGDGGSSTEYFTYCVATFPAELRFGLQLISPKGILSGVLKSSDIVLGNPTFDNAFSSVCYDQRVLKRLLLSDFPSQRTGNLMGDLMLAYEEYGTVKVTDKKVYIEIHGMERDPQTLKRLLAVTNGAARRFAEARQKFPLEEWEKSLIDNWKNFGKKSGLSFDPSVPRLTGIYQGHPVDLFVHCEPGRWLTTLQIRYPQKLMVGFSIYPEKSYHKVAKIFGFQDLKAGHDVFDKAYVVKAKNKQVALARLTPDFCDQMVGLDKHTHDILINDEEMKMTLTQVLGEPNSLKSYLAAMISAMKKLR
jgi:hypothetical protein